MRKPPPKPARDAEGRSDDLARARSADHDDRGAGRPWETPAGVPQLDIDAAPTLLPHDHPPRPASMKIGASVQQLAGLSSAGRALGGTGVPGQLAVIIWKVTPGDVIAIGAGATSCSAPLPSVPLRIETGATIFAAHLSGPGGDVGVVVEVA